MTEKNKITRAEFLIYKYVECLFIEIRVLNSDNIEEALNMPSHNLSKKELAMLLWKMFETGCLVARSDNRNYFSPTLEELKEALSEFSSFKQRLNNTFYGFVGTNFERFDELNSLWESDFANQII